MSEIKYGDLKLGWLAPEGTLVVTERYGHIDGARKLVDALNYSNLNDALNVIPDDDVLLDHGWCMITKGEFDYKFRFGWKNFLTGPQKSYLRKYLTQNDWVDPFVLYRIKQELEEEA